jgi:hypothetical protein
VFHSSYSAAWENLLRSTCGAGGEGATESDRQDLMPARQSFHPDAFGLQFGRVHQQSFYLM